VHTGSAVMQTRITLLVQPFLCVIGGLWGQASAHRECTYAGGIPLCKLESAGCYKHFCVSLVVWGDKLGYTGSAVARILGAWQQETKARKLL
jgi:hypothetical protein